MKANRDRARQLTEELKNEVEEKCVRITKQGFVGENGAHYTLSYPDDVKEENEDEGIEVFENVGDPQFSRRKKAPAYEYDHSSWQSYLYRDTEKKAFSHKDIKDCIVIENSVDIASETIVTLFEDGTLCSSNDDDLIRGYDKRKSPKAFFKQTHSADFQNGDLEVTKSMSLGNKAAYNNAEIPEGAKDKKFVSIHRISDSYSPQCAIAISEDGEYFIIGQAPKRFNVMLNSNCDVIIAREMSAGGDIECVGIKADGSLIYVTSNSSKEEYVEQMEDAEDIADIAFHKSHMYDEDEEYFGFELYAAVSHDNKISIFGSDDYIKEYTSMIPSEFQT